MTPQAFTIESECLLSSIITQASIRQSAHLCKINKLKCQYANDIRALWDTGATGSCISHSIARYLDLKPVDMTMVRGVTGITESPIYVIDILLPSHVVIENLRVTEFLDNGFFEIIIGMDIITLGDFAVSNAVGKTMVSFRIPPSNTPIDFIKNNSENEKT
jgi:hypothetical protein